MKDNEKLELLLERFYNRYNKYNTKVLKRMGEVIKKFDGVTPTVAHQIAQELKIGTEIDELITELSKITKMSVDDIYKAFEIVAKENEQFAETYAKAKAKELNQEKIEKIINAISKETSKNMINIANTRTVGFTFERKGKKVFVPFKKAYTDLIDEAVYNVEIGVQDYQSAMRNTIKQLADSGVKVNESKIKYKSGYSRRIDSAVRQDVLTGVRQLNIELQQEIGKQLGANGVEISAHFPCAEDHLPIQGRQYSNKEFEKLNRTLDRPIGEYNCRHFVFSIILGVNLPSYTPSQLKKLNDDSMQKITYNGKEYTKYEASQVQRKFEIAIRKQKDLQIIARSSGNAETVDKAQQNISALTSEYNKFSQIAGLKTYKNRLVVSGYNKVKIGKNSLSVYKKEEIAALNTYISPSSITLNDKLRNNIKLNAIEKNVVKNLDSALEKTPNYKGNIVRTMVMDNPSVFINQLEVGKEYSTNQYLSFSTKEEYHKEPNIKIYVEDSKKAKDLTEINKIGENEVLYQRNKKFITENIMKKKDIYYILWKEK